MKLEFDEVVYLKINPDINELVKNGHFDSGLDHFLQHGRQEGRLSNYASLVGHSVTASACLKKTLVEREELIASLSQCVVDRDSEIRVTKDEVGHILIVNRELQQQLNQVLNSRSWHVTAPLRKMVALVCRALPSVTLLFLGNLIEFLKVRRELILKTSIRQIRASSLFDADYYLTRNPDVRDAGMDTAKHFLFHGWREHRDPSAAFSTSQYLFDNPDVARAQVNPLIHYLRNGQQEGRAIALQTSSSEVMSSTDMVHLVSAFHEDLVEVGGLPATLNDDLPEVGDLPIRNEDENVSNAAIDAEVEAIRKSGLFDESFYRSMYADLHTAPRDAIRHYCEYGWREGRNPSDDFDTSFYLATYSDIRNAGINPFWHYVVAGATEMRHAIPDLATRYEDDIRFGMEIAFTSLKRAHRQLAATSALCRAVPRAVSFYQGSLRLTIRRVFGVLKREGISGVVRRANILVHGVSTGRIHSSIALYGEVPPPAPGFLPKVSIIVPNFNHAKYLLERLESIYGQTYCNVEVILLDDCSTDESVAILRDFAERYPSKTICHFNEANSGGVFNQWKKGLELATGELVWIAESDDYCSTNLLEELVRCFQNPAVMLAFARTEFVRGTPPMKAWTSEEYLSDLGLGIWERPFIKSAHAMVKSGWAVKNIVPNVSGAVFRHPGKMGLLDDVQWLNLRMCGDWVFYLSIIRGGLVAYSPDATNYYRQHSLNTSVNAQKEDLYYREHEVVALYLAKLYQLDRADFKKQERQLYQHWCTNRGASQLAEFRRLYDLDKVWQRTIDRRPNIVMAIYALAAGGGETFPIMLANLLHDRGYAVTLLNCKEQSTEPGVQRMLLGSIPLLELDRLELSGAVFSDMGVELVHSHHAWVDVTMATVLFNNLEIRQIVSMHGMYEMMTPAQLQTLMPLLKRRIDRFVYTAEKNLSPFSLTFRQEKGFCKINNALPLAQIVPISRVELNVGDDDFVLCMVARAIPEKGWEEAIDAVAWASARSSRKVHLLLIGEGPEFDRLKSKIPHEFVHFLGFRSNIRDYFATSDIGFLPSRFKGESSPLVLIDCLHSGKPVLASNIGEIRNMLELEDGLAGELFDLEDWAIPVETVGRIILKLANDPITYKGLLDNVPLAADKFDISVMVDKYEAVYSSSLTATKKNAVPNAIQKMRSQS